MDRDDLRRAIEWLQLIRRTTAAQRGRLMDLLMLGSLRPDGGVPADLPLIRDALGVTSAELRSEIVPLVYAYFDLVTIDGEDALAFRGLDVPPRDPADLEELAKREAMSADPPTAAVN